MTIKSLLKDWTLPFSMVVGAISYVALTQIEALQNTKAVLSATVPYLLPTLIFVMSLFSYCKIEPRDLKPRLWHLWLILIQMAEVLVYPLVEPGMGMTFFELFLKILSRVFPTIMAPLAIALCMKWLIPKAHKYVAASSHRQVLAAW